MRFHLELRLDPLVSLLQHPGSKARPERFLKLLQSRGAGQVLLFKGIAAQIIHFDLRAALVAFNDPAGLLVGLCQLNPRFPVSTLVAAPNQDIPEGFGILRVPDVFVGRGSYRADGIAGGAVDNPPGGMNPENHLVVFFGFSLQDPEKALPIETLDLLPADGIQEGRHHVHVLDHGIGNVAGPDLTRPANNHGDMEPHIVAGPLAPGELGPLLAGIDKDRVLFTAMLLHGRHAFTQLPVEVGNLSVIPGEGCTGLGRIDKLRRDPDLGGVVSRGVSSGPGQVRAVRGDDQAIRLALLAPNEFPHLGPGNHLKGERGRRAEVLLAAEADPVATVAKEMHHAAGPRLHLAVIGIGSVSNGKQPRVKLLPGGSAHRRCGKGPGETHSLRRQPVDVRSLHLAVTVAAGIIPGLVIC